MPSKLRELRDQLAELKKELDGLYRNQKTLLAQIERIERAIELEKRRSQA